MTASRSPFRRALVALVALCLGASGAVAVSTAATAAPGQPIMIVGSIFGTTTGGTMVTAIVDDDLDQTVRVWYLRPGVSDQAERELFCDFFVAASGTNGGNCSGSFPPGVLGEYTLFVTADDGTGESVPSDSLVFPVGESAASVPVTVGGDLGTGVQQVQESLLVTVEGEAPAMSRVVVSATSVSPAVATNLCIIERVPVSGEYECVATLPSPRYGQWTISVQARDVAALPVTITALGGPFSIVVPAPQPAVDASAAPAAAAFTVTGEPTSNVGGELLLNGFGTPTSAGFCPAGWSGSPLAPPTGGNSVTCGFPSLPAGIHILESGQFINGTATYGREDALYVPATPSLTVEAVPGGAIFRGTVDPLSEQLTIASSRLDALEVVVRDAADQAVCGAEADLLSGDWVCAAALEPGTDSFTAEAKAVGFGFDPGVGFGEVDGYAGGSSARSATVGTTIPATGGVAPPAMTYGLGPASIDVRAVGLPNSAVQLDLYQVEVVPGEPYQYGTAVAGCGLPDGGEGGLNGTVPPTSPSVVDDCFFSGLAPGVWNIYATQYYYFDQSDYLDHYVLIPERPTLTARVTGADQVVASGTGDPGYRVLVQQLGGAGGCSTTVSSTGTWSCPVSGVAGDVVLRAQQRSQGFVADPPSFFGAIASYDGFSAYTAPVAVSVPAVPAPPVVATTPLVWTLEGYDGSPLTPGQVLPLSARGLPAQTEVVIEIRSTPQTLGSARASDLGLVALDVTVPFDLEPGEHTLVGIATPPGGEPSAVQIPVTVLAIDPVDDGAGAPGTGDPFASPDASGGRGEAADRSDPAAPSAISDSIPTIDRIFRTPLLLVTGGGLALALLLLVAFPAELLNNTIASNSRRIGRWYAALDDRLERFTEWFAQITRSRAIAAGLLVTITAVVFGFVDPDYGLDPVSLRMTVSLALGLFVVTYVASWISGRIVQRVWEIPCRVGLQPAALLFAVVGVILARLLEFSPGFLIGLVIGLDVLARVGAPYRVKALVTNLAVTVGLALLGWIGFSVMVALTAGDPGWVEMLVSDALVATAAEGLTAALASLLPLGFLAGHEIAKQSRALWIACFAVVATLFAVVVLPTAEGETEAIDVGFWLLVMGGFAVVVLALWAVLHVTGRDDDPDAEPLHPSHSTVTAAR